MNPAEMETVSGTMRLNRFLARSGVASRRKSDALIAQGVVRVNGQVISQAGVSVDPAVDRVEYDGRVVCLPGTLEYVLFHKPLDCLVTRSDTRGRPTIFAHLVGLRSGTMPVGRLDMDTSGLLLLTDDGELAFRLMHPRFVVDKVYEAVVSGRPDEGAAEKLRQGVELDDGMTAPARVEIGPSHPRDYGVDTRLVLTIHEGRKRQVRRMLRAVGHPVRQLHRTELAGLHLDLPEPGSWRRLSTAEVAALGAQVGLERGD
jgi:23S rRNA pseudouridine2605 synthase